eukprot:TRINITY_DN14381_c0_g1_i1.p1 TRINITY_DN14381_c0_g1~~TRINITY_DN14381_c0_g1_i1.p1  ORF type:complete len:266 (+),score=95.72 TRINITY_DN14381_c0_g1_i1:88-798(+)
MTTGLGTEIRLVVLGAGAVGKSCLTIQFVQGNFIDQYAATVEDAYRKQAEIDGTMHQLDILDTAGQEEYRTLMQTYFRKGDGFLIVYSILDEDSWVEAGKLYTTLVEQRPDYQAAIAAGKRVPIVICGNKLDLVLDQPSSRAVATADLQEKAKQWSCKAFETSAKSRVNVEEAFHEAIRGVKMMQSLAGSKEFAAATAAAASTGNAGGAAAAPAAPSPPEEERKEKKKKKKKCAIL